VNKTPKVTVILSSYNHEKYIRESIESVLNQTFSDFQLIIVDDSSTDNSWQIINSYNDCRIHALQNTTNRSSDFSEILPEDFGSDYIAVHHSDDAWEPRKLEKQVEILDSNPDIAAVFTHVQIIDEEGKPFTDEKNFYFDVFDQPNRSRFEWLNHFFYKGNVLCHPSLLIRTRCIKEIEFTNGLAQLPDFDKWIQLCLKHEIFVIQEKLTLFRVRAQELNVSGDRPETRIRLLFEYLQTLKHYLKIPNIEDFLQIFPQAEKYINEQNSDLLFALGMLSVETGNNAAIRLFGLNLLFDALNAPNRAVRLEKYQHFDKKSFINLTAQHDVFNYEVVHNHKNQLQKKNNKIKELEQQIKEMDQEIHKLEQQWRGREQEILFYALSKSWRFTRPFRKFFSRLRRRKNA